MRFCSEQDHDPKSQPCEWVRLATDLTETILSRLPLRDIVRSRVVCKQWNAIVTQESFASRVSRTKKPWFFLHGQNNVFLKNNQAFGFDPESMEWIRLPSTIFPRPRPEYSFVGAGGFFFITTCSSPSRFQYSPLLRDSWQEAAPLRFSRSNPLVGVFSSGESLRFIVVGGGARFIGGLVDIEERSAVEIYDCRSDSWELCPQLPPNFRPGNSSQSLSSTVLNGNFFVYEICRGLLSAFDLNRRLWSRVRTLKPPGVLFSFLLSCQNLLILVGLCNNGDGPLLKLWRINEEPMTFHELAVMPRDLLNCLVEMDEDDKLASLKCVGLGGIVYIFNEEHSRVYPACACEISQELQCTWWRVPELPPPVSKFHKVNSFCSKVSLNGILGHQPRSWMV